MTTAILRNREEAQSRVPKVKTRRSIFPAKWNRKQTIYASYITPIMCKKVYPGETMKIDLTTFIRLNTQVVCPIDNLQVETFFFYVPDRLVWDNHKYYMGEKKNDGTDSTYIKPRIEIPAEKNIAGSLWNCLSASRLGVSCYVDALPFRKHNLIYNEMFRDSDCQEIKKVKKDDSDDDINDYDLYRIHKSRDYFVNSTKDMQKGEPINIPLGDTAPVIGNTKALGLIYTKETSRNTFSKAVLANSKQDSNDPGITLRDYVKSTDIQSELSGNLIYDNSLISLSNNPNDSNVYTLLNKATGAKLDQLRQAIFTEEYLEALNRGGNKYADLMHNIYDVTIPDLTIQIPQYLGGTSAPFFTNPVIQTSGTGESETPQGNIAGFGVNSDGGKVINCSFLEFGHIMGYIVVKAQPQYQQGLDREWHTVDYLEEWNPFFNNLSDQAIKMSEIYQYNHDEKDENGNLKNDKVFGYIGRFDHMRYFKNEIAGELNSEYQYTLDSWHYAEKFEDEPNNNESFMEDKTYEILDRSMAITYEDNENNIKSPQLIADINFDGFVTLPIPTHATPKLTNTVY